MAQPLKEIFFQPKFFTTLAQEIKYEYSSFDSQKFLGLVFDKNWERLELKARMIHAAKMLHIVLPQNYSKALQILVPVSKKFDGFDAIIFCQFVEEFGINNFKESMRALEVTTVEASAEGAIRPFIVKYPKQAMAQMLQWSKHKNEHVRRLSSEGCRPLLPWNIRLYQFVDNPSPILPILENLKNDSSLYVRKSVANNLNDISKHHPDLVLNIAESWYGKTKETDWIVKHALRTLLKKGDLKALRLFGFGNVNKVTVEALTLESETLSIGNTLHFCFDLELKSKLKQKLRLEYAIHYVKANGSLSKKIFQISEKEFSPGKVSPIKRKQSFKNMSTRKHYSGQHKLEILINGQTMAEKVFQLHD